MKVDEFLFHEARLLDTGQLEAWLALFAEDATYWLPLERDQKDAIETSSIIYDDKTLLDLRVKQARHPRAHARLPLARTVHQISNISFVETAEKEIKVHSTLVLVEFRSEKQRIWGASVEHHLRRAGDSFRIAHKRVELVNSEGELDGIAILLSKIFRGYTQQELDAQYNQRAWVPDVERIVAGMAATSEQVRKKIGEPRSERYGVSELETLDIYGRGKKAFVFVHGGAWQRESRRGSAYGAAPIVAAGASFVVIGFAAIPRVTIAEMAAQVLRGIEWVYENVSKDLVLFGHSSGAHLSAVALTNTTAVKRAMVVSGLYDLHPVRISARQAYVKLDDRAEDDLSPIRHVDRIRCPVTVACAEKDSDEFRRQAKEFSEAVKTDLLQVKDVNHFEIVETLADPASPLGRAALTMLQ